MKFFYFFRPASRPRLFYKTLLQLDPADGAAFGPLEPRQHAPLVVRVPARQRRGVLAPLELDAADGTLLLSLFSFLFSSLVGVFFLLSFSFPAARRRSSPRSVGPDDDSGKSRSAGLFGNDPYDVCQGREALVRERGRVFVFFFFVLPLLLLSFVLSSGATFLPFSTCSLFPPKSRRCPGSIPASASM